LTGGNKTVTLANIELLDEDINEIPAGLVPAKLSVADAGAGDGDGAGQAADVDFPVESGGAILDPESGLQESPASSDGNTAAGDADGSSADDRIGGSADLTASPASWRNPFADVKASDWFFEAVRFVAQNDFMNGTATDGFSPQTAMTRAMIVTVLGRLSGADVSAYAAGSFSDVRAGQYYAAYVEWAKEGGIVNGVGDGRFAPNAEITRQDLAVLLARCAEFSGKQFPATLQYARFADDARIADYAKNAVETLYCGGIVSGKPGNSFDPHGSATRAETAAMLHRYAEAIK
jgi:hypothetical protein